MQTAVSVCPPFGVGLERVYTQMTMYNRPMHDMIRQLTVFRINVVALSLRTSLILCVRLRAGSIIRSDPV